MAEHHCHAVGCEVPTPRAHLMCGKHWAMVPKALQLEVWRTYREGQCREDGKVRPGRAWVAAAARARAAVARAEGRTKAAAYLERVASVCEAVRRAG